MLSVKNKIDIQDILYGGIAGEMPLPDLVQSDSSNLIISDTKPSLKSENSPEVISYPEAISATASGDMDIRPRVFDSISKEYILVDTGSMCSVTKPSSSDALRHDLLLEAVDGSNLPCYGLKDLSLRLNRKEYHIKTVISNTTDTILGMDFIDKYQMEFRRGEFGDLYLYDKKAQISIPCQFVKMHQSNLPRTAALRLASTSHHESTDPDWQSQPSLTVFGAAALTGTSTPNVNAIPAPYKKTSR